MPIPITPRSRTLAALRCSRGTYMDTVSVRKWHTTLTVFFVSWFVLFSTMSTFYPKGLMRNSDFLDTFGTAATNDNSDRKDDDNNVLSDSGKSAYMGSIIRFLCLDSSCISFHLC